MLTKATQAKRVIFVRMSYGDDVLASLREAVKRENIKNAVILSGFGSVSKYHFHVVTTGELPPGEAYPKADKPMDVVAMSGAIIDGRVHAHITLTDDAIAMGGHVEPECIVLTFLIVTIQEVDNALDMTDWDHYRLKI